MNKPNTDPSWKLIGFLMAVTIATVFFVEVLPRI